MRMRILRKLKKLEAQAPRVVRRRFDLTDVSMDMDAGPSPEVVFDRITGPYGRRYGADEET